MRISDVDALPCEARDFLKTLFVLRFALKMEWKGIRYLIHRFNLMMARCCCSVGHVFGREICAISFDLNWMGMDEGGSWDSSS